MFKKSVIAASLALVSATAFAAPAPAPAKAPVAVEAPQVVVFKNVNIFNGTENKLYKNHSVIVTGNKITAIQSGDVKVPADAEIIDGEGRTLMPALIDAHMHLALPEGLVGTNDVSWAKLAVHGQQMAEMYLDMGFGTIRDVGGTDGSWTEMEKEGFLKEVPRIYTSGAPIAPVGGHSDTGAATRTLFDGPTHMEKLGIMSITNGEKEVQAQARQNFRSRAQFVKIFSSGGVSSKFDPWQYQSLTDAEVRAAVEIAESYGSYVATHAYSHEALHQALDNGVKSIEHGFMFNESHHKKFVEKGAFLATNLTAFSPELAKIPVTQDPAVQKKLASAQAAFGTYIDNVNKLDPDYRAMNVDCVGYTDICAKQIAHEIYLNAHFFGNFSALKAMTSTPGRISAELMEDWIDPYSDAKLGVIEVGAYADILLVDGNPLEDISVIGGRETWLDNNAKPDGSHLTEMDLIMKDGKIFKNTL